MTVNPSQRKTIGTVLISLGFFIMIGAALVGLYLREVQGWDERSIERWWFGVVLPIGWLLVIAGSALRTVPHVPMDDKTFGSLRFGWIMFFVLSAGGLILTVTEWTVNQPTPTFLQPWLPLAAIVPIIIYRGLRGGSFLEAFAASHEAQVRDERERFIVYQATRYAFAVGIFILLIVMAMILFLPPPSRQAVAFLLLSLLFLFVGLREFFAWRLRLWR